MTACKKWWESALERISTDFPFQREEHRLLLLLIYLFWNFLQHPPTLLLYITRANCWDMFPSETLTQPEASMQDLLFGQSTCLEHVLHVIQLDPQQLRRQMLWWWVGVRRGMKGRETTLRSVPLNPESQTVFCICNLTTHFKVTPSQHPSWVSLPDHIHS